MTSRRTSYVASAIGTTSYDVPEPAPSQVRHSCPDGVAITQNAAYVRKPAGGAARAGAVPPRWDGARRALGSATSGHGAGRCDRDLGRLGDHGPRHRLAAALPDRG